MSEEQVKQWQTEFLLMQKDLTHMVENQAKTNELYSQSIQELKESAKETTACIRELTNSNLQLQKALEEIPQLRSEIKNLQDTQIAQAGIIEGIKDFKKIFNRAVATLVCTAILGVVAQNIVSTSASDSNNKQIEKVIKEAMKGQK